MKLEPKRTAIISLDVQNDLVHNTPGVLESGMLDRMAAVLAAGREAGAEIIHITASVRADFKDIPKDNPLWRMVRRQKSMVLGTEGARLHERVAAQPGELVLNKTCVDPSCFLASGQITWWRPRPATPATSATASSSSAIAAPAMMRKITNGPWNVCCRL